MPALKYDLTGQVFGLVTALHHITSGKWLIRCECGTEKVVEGQNLRQGRIKSCGCANSAGRFPTGSKHPRRKPDHEIRYTTAHRRVAAARGPAREHPCIACGEESNSWAYRGNSPRELTEPVPAGHRFKPEGALLRYSPDPDDYDPMCWTCHARKDLAERVNNSVN